MALRLLKDNLNKDELREAFLSIESGNKADSKKVKFYVNYVHTLLSSEQKTRLLQNLSDLTGTRRRPDPDERRPDPDERRPDPDERRPDPDERRPDPDDRRPDPDGNSGDLNTFIEAVKTIDRSICALLDEFDNMDEMIVLAKDLGFDCVVRKSNKVQATRGKATQNAKLKQWFVDTTFDESFYKALSERYAGNQDKKFLLSKHIEEEVIPSL
jgi:hypothetical protein